jgi:hypothetical protein
LRLPLGIDVPAKKVEVAVDGLYCSQFIDLHDKCKSCNDIVADVVRDVIVIPAPTALATGLMKT